MRFDYGDGYTDDTAPDQTVVTGYPATRPDDPVREGYRFRGWQLDSQDYDLRKSLWLP